MGANKLFPFMHKGNAVSNFDEIVETGFYRVAGQSYTNTPQSSLYGVLLVFKDKTSYITQVLISLLGTPGVWARSGTFTNNSYEDWKRLTLG